MAEAQYHFKLNMLHYYTTTSWFLFKDKSHMMVYTSSLAILALLVCGSGLVLRLQFTSSLAF